MTGSRAPVDTIIVIPLSLPPHKLETDWAATCGATIPRHCQICGRDSIVGHGRRRKQAHDEHHDWIDIRRGRCSEITSFIEFLRTWLRYLLDFSCWQNEHLLQVIVHGS